MYNFLKKLSMASLLVCFASFSNLSADCLQCAPGVSQRLADTTLPYGALYEDLTADSFVETVSAQVVALEADPTLANYNALLQTAYDIVNSIAPGSFPAVSEPPVGLTAPVLSPRVVITEADGTVIVDTARYFLGLVVGPNLGLYVRQSTLANWLTNTVGENHNTRIAILDAQLYPCGVGLETKFSSTLTSQYSYIFPISNLPGSVIPFPAIAPLLVFYQDYYQHYVAVRLNAYNNGSDTDSYLRSAGTIRLSVNTTTIPFVPPITP